MHPRDLRRAIAVVTIFVGAAVAGGRAQVKPSDQPLALQQIPWRHIGPASFGGRIDDIEAVPANSAPTGDSRSRCRSRVYQSTLAPTRSTRGGTIASGRRKELPELQLVF